MMALSAHVQEIQGAEDVMEVDQSTTIEEDPQCEAAATQAECAFAPFAGEVLEASRTNAVAHHEV